MKVLKVIDRKAEVVREVSRNYVPQHQEHLFYLADDTQEILHKKPVFKIGTRSWTPYVLNTKKVFEYRNLTTSLKELDDSISLDVVINYKIQFTKSTESSLLKALIKEDHAQDGLDNQILDWADQYIAVTPGFVSQFFEKQESMIDFIREQAQDAGLRIEISINPRNPPGDIKRLEGKIDIQVKDYIGKVILAYQLSIDPIEEQKAFIFLAKPDKVKQFVEESIKSTISTSPKIDLHALYFIQKKVKKEGDSVKMLIYQSLTKRLAKHSIKPMALELKTELEGVPLEHQNFKHKTQGDTSAGSVTVDHSIRLKLEDLGLYLSSGITDLKAWVLDALDQTTQDYIFKKDLTDLLLHFDADEIKNRISNLLGTIGFSVEHHVTNRDLDQLIPRQLNLLIEEEAFQTRVHDISATLQIEVIGPFSDIAKLGQFISGAHVLNAKTVEKRVETLKEDVTSIIKEEIRQVMFETEPNDFYLYFETSDAPKKESVSAILKRQISRRLKKDFGINKPRIRLTQVSMDLVDELERLRGDTRYVIAENKSGTFRYKLPFEVLTIHPEHWLAFKSKCDALEGADPKEILSQIAVTLKGFVDDLFITLDKKDVDRVLDHFQMKEALTKNLDRANLVIEEDFGVTLKFSKVLIPLELEGESDEREIYRLLQQSERDKQKALIKRRSNNLEDLLKAEKSQAYTKPDEAIKQLDDMDQEILQLPDTTSEPKKLPPKRKSNTTKTKRK